MIDQIVRVFLLFVVSLILFENAVRSEMVLLTTDLDTTVYANDGSRSNGGGSVIFAGSNTAISPRRGLLRFNVAGSLPIGAVVESAQLTLRVAGFGGTGVSDATAYATYLHAVSRTWGEGTAGTGSGATGSGQGFATPTNGTSATWTHAFYNSQPWNTAGGDFDSEPHSVALVTGNIDAAFTWGSTLALISDVQNWLDVPANNFGWLLVGNETTAQSFRSFYSHEASNVALRPSLEITYSLVPEPSSLILTLLGSTAFGFARRRRVLVNSKLHENTLLGVMG